MAHYVSKNSLGAGWQMDFLDNEGINTNPGFLGVLYHANAAKRTYTFPDKDGTVAMTSDITGGMTNPMTTLGDIIVGGASGTPGRLGGNTTTTPQFLMSTGSGGLATTPSWAGSTGAGNVVLATGPTFGAGAKVSLPAGTATTASLHIPNGPGNPSGAVDGDVWAMNGHLYFRSSALGSVDITGGIVNPMSAQGDIIYGAMGGTPQRLGVGALGQFLSVGAGPAPAWASPDRGILPAAVCASTGVVNIASPGATIDGVGLSAGHRVLLWMQTLSYQNGPWIWNGAAVPMTRPADYPSGSTVHAYRGLMVTVTSGTSNGGCTYAIQDAGTLTIDTTPVGWALVPTAIGSAARVTGALPITNGGTGQITAPLALNALLPAQGSANGMFLGSNGSVASWVAGLANPMTTLGDIIVGGASGAPDRLAKGTDGQILAMVAGAPAWRSHDVIGTATGNGATNLDGALLTTIQVNVTGNTTLNMVSGGSDGQRLSLELKQDASGSHTIAIGTGFAWGSDITTYTPTPTALKTDYIGLVYSTAAAAWRIIAIAKGY